MKISNDDLKLLMTAIRRAFSRSSLRKEVLEKAKTPYIDLSRPRVKNWFQCNICKNCFAGYQMQIDHIIPIVPVNKGLTEMKIYDLIERTFCNIDNLQASCLDCHKAKSKEENKLRREYRKKRKEKNV